MGSRVWEAAWQPPATGSEARAGRYMLVDLARGVAIVLMIVYHFVFDLNYFNHLGIDFNHEPFWLGFRALIVSLFLGIVGVSLHLATRRGLKPVRYLRRLGLLVLCAGLVSAASYVVFPETVIFFGILHFIAVASVLGLFAVRFYRLNLLLGIAVLLTGLFVAHPLFDHPALQWVGLMTHKPLTEDYVPLLPWFGVVLIGLFIGRTICDGNRAAGIALWSSRHPLLRAVAFGGRHSLLIYMVHQPLLFGLLYGILGRPAPI